VTTDGGGHRKVTGGVVTLTVWRAQMMHLCEPSRGSAWNDSTSGPVAKYIPTRTHPAMTHNRCARDFSNSTIRMVYAVL